MNQMVSSTYKDNLKLLSGLIFSNCNNSFFFVYVCEMKNLKTDIRKLGTSLKVWYAHGIKFHIYLPHCPNVIIVASRNFICNINFSIYEQKLFKNFIYFNNLCNFFKKFD